MGIFSSSASVTPYFVEGKVQEPIIDTIAMALNNDSIQEIDNEPSDKAIGWACFNNPFSTDFNRCPFLIGSYFVFCMRIDKKSISAKVVQKHVSQEINKRLTISGRDFLTKSEKKEIKDNIVNRLNLMIPSTPHTYDLIWNYEAKTLWFFSNLKSANEELETLFYRSFKAKLIRLFPYTMATLTLPLSNDEKNSFLTLTPTRLME